MTKRPASPASPTDACPASKPKSISPHKLMRTWRYKETKHSLKKKVKTVTLNFPLSSCSFTADQALLEATLPASPASPSSPSSPMALSPPTSPIFYEAMAELSSPRSLLPFPHSSSSHSPSPSYDHKPEDPLAYFMGKSTTEKIRLPTPALPIPLLPVVQRSVSMSCCC